MIANGVSFRFRVGTSWAVEVERQTVADLETLIERLCCASRYCFLAVARPYPWSLNCEDALARRRIAP